MSEGLIVTLHIHTHATHTTTQQTHHTSRSAFRLSGLEEKNSDLAEVEVDEVLRLVGDIAAEVTANDAVPRGVVLLVELLLDVGGDVLLNVELLHGLGRDLDGVGLHVLGHIGVLDNCLAVSGGHCS
eukprot:TRINITY_DN1152_c0_g1_i13.p1 TRINITY_DN1152_c0_g1~~TRINITY_DN1152_c0_g1_i13.p1  ORF type:complete len:127 (-),score=0.67 TRINITY_DN1152_c0_g1_i13:76-456(-)